MIDLKKNDLSFSSQNAFLEDIDVSFTDIKLPHVIISPIGYAVFYSHLPLNILVYIFRN